MPEPVAAVWQRVASPGVPAAWWLLAVTVAAGAVLVAWSRSWSRLRMAVTVPHEAGHALVGAVTGRRVDGIRLHADTSGDTTTTGRPGGLGLWLTTAAGYPFPAVLGAGLVVAAGAGWSRAAAAVGVAALTVMLLLTRNVRAAVLLLGFGGLVAAVAWWAPDVAVTVAVGVVAGFWAAGSVRSLWEERGARRAGEGTDVAALSASTGAPAAVWWMLLMGSIVAAGVAGGWAVAALS